MTHRERWLRTMHFQSPDHIPDQEFGYWSDTLVRWRKEGLPEWVTDDGKAERYFGFAPAAGVPVNQGLIPGFESRTIEETDEYVIYIDGSGVKQMVPKDGHSTIPKYLEFPLKGPEDWPKFVERLNPNDPERYPKPADWEAWKQRWARPDREIPLFIGAGSLFGWIRNWMGFEGVALAVYDHPRWMHEVVDYLCDFLIRTMERALNEVPGIDGAGMWEDMAFRSGTIISPKMFDELLVPRYKRLTDRLREAGVDVVWLDCDGNISEVVGLWLKGGVNCMFPVEVRGGSDPVAIRRKYGHDVLMMGGVDKTRLIEGKKAIDEEIARLAPIVEDGAYIPHVDHRCPPDVSYENYLYYLHRKREMFGIPEPQGVASDQSPEE